MVSTRFIMSVKNGIVQKASKFAKKYTGSADNVPIETQFSKSNFRGRELFKPLTDSSQKFPTYASDDLPFSLSLTPQLHRRSNEILSQCIDTDIQFTELIGTGGKKVFLETVFSHPYYNGNQYIMEYLEAGHSFYNAANILNNAKGYLNKGFLNEAMDLIKNGHPLEQVMKNMDEALLSSPQRYERGLMSFIAENPGKRNFVVVKDKYENEVFDKIGALNYRVFESLCPDETTLRNVMHACRYKTKEGVNLTSDDLSMIAMELLQRNKEWSSLDTLILNSLKGTCTSSCREYEWVDTLLGEKILAWIKGGVPSEEIIMKLNKLGVRK